MMIADVNRQAADHVAAVCSIPRATAQAEEVIADPNVDAVVICSSTETHVDLIMAAARAGKHIFCEKPSTAIWRASIRRWRRSKPRGRSDSIGGLIRVSLASTGRLRAERPARLICSISSAATRRLLQFLTSKFPAASSWT